MKTKVFAITLTAVMGLSTSDNAEAWNPFKKSPTFGSGQKVEHTERKGMFTRGLRYARQRFATACDSTNAGKIDGFRRCLASFLGGSASMDKRSSVLALDSNGKPLLATVNRETFKQDWFRRWMLLNIETNGLLSALQKANGDLSAAEEEQSQAESDGASSSKLEGLKEKVEALETVVSTIQAQITDSWDSFYTLSEEIAQATNTSPQFTKTSEDVPLTSVPEPDALNPVFTPTQNISGSPLMSADFAALLEQFADKNPNALRNFCHNFFAVGPSAGYEADYVRLADTGDISPAMVTRYQTNKMANMAAKCSENSMRGLTLRKIYSLCALDEGGRTLAACSGFSSSEVATSQQQSTAG